MSITSSTGKNIKAFLKNESGADIELYFLILCLTFQMIISSTVTIKSWSIPALCMGHWF